MRETIDGDDWPTAKRNDCSGSRSPSNLSSMLRNSAISRPKEAMRDLHTQHNTLSCEHSYYRESPCARACAHMKL